MVNQIKIFSFKIKRQAKKKKNNKLSECCWKDSRHFHVNRLPVKSFSYVNKTKMSFFFLKKKKNKNVIFFLKKKINKIRLDISCESSAGQTIHKKYQVWFSLRAKNTKSYFLWKVKKKQKKKTTTKKQNKKKKQINNTFHKDVCCIFYCHL